VAARTSVPSGVDDTDEGSGGVMKQDRQIQQHRQTDKQKNQASNVLLATHCNTLTQSRQILVLFYGFTLIFWPIAHSD
jgi:hypothetical protein